MMLRYDSTSILVLLSLSAGPHQQYHSRAVLNARGLQGYQGFALVSSCHLRVFSVFNPQQCRRLS